jgi:hypothetical protein
LSPCPPPLPPSCLTCYITPMLDLVTQLLTLLLAALRGTPQTLPAATQHSALSTQYYLLPSSRMVSELARSNPNPPFRRH